MKNKLKLFSISEACLKLGLVNKVNGKTQNHTLRYWEKEFKFIKPKKLSGRRYYSSREIEKIELIKYLLKEQGLTIEGVKKILDNKINKLDDLETSSINAEYFKKRVKNKTLKLLNKIKKLKWPKKHT
jgi:DNA-binding transcriptional MerR regulator